MQLVHYCKKLGKGVLVLTTLFLSGQFVYADSSGHNLESLVKDLYKRYEWEALPENHHKIIDGVTLADEKLDILQRYFSNDLASALWKDAECTERSREICALGFVVIYDSQDPYAKNLKVSVINSMTMKVCYQNQKNDAVCLTYVGGTDEMQPKINDIYYGDGRSLREILGLKKQ